MIIHTFHPDWAESEPLKLRKPHQKYVNSQGDYLPGVTSALGLVKDPKALSALMNWAVDCFKKGKDHEEEKNKAADIGTIAHYLCECWLRKHNAVFDDAHADHLALALESFKKFETFWNESNFRIEHNELQLASETHGYGGTIDIIARDSNNNLVVVDIKTSKYIFPSYVSQVYAYEMLYKERYNDRLQGCNGHRRIIVRIGKEKASDFQVLEIPSSSENVYSKFFLACLEVYKSWKQVELYNQMNNFLYFPYVKKKTKPVT